MNKPVGRQIIRIKNFDKSTKVIEHDHIEIYDKSPLRGLGRKYVPTAGDRIYIYPGTNIPRFKLKRFCETYKVAVAKVKETATVFFMDPKTANDERAYFEQDSAVLMMNKQYFVDFIKKSTRVGDARYVKLLQDLAASPQPDIYMADYYEFERTGINKYTLNAVTEDDLEEDDDGNVDLTLVNTERVDKLYFIETNEQRNNFAFLEGKDFYHPDAMLALLNEGSVLDKEMYDGIMNLFNSKDMNDHKVAMEAMANCDYQKSAVYLLMTFYHHQNQIYNCDTRNHVNFKSFLNFFDLNATRGIHIDDIIERLKDKKLLTRSNLNIVMAKAKELLDESATNVSTYFVPTGIAPIEEIIKEVEETDSLQTPAIPVADPMTETQITDL